MDWPRQCAAVIPCLNEAERIAFVVSGVREHLPKVIVVDDGSKDATLEEAARAGAEVLHHAAPTGKGRALQDGWHRAMALGYSWALCLDGDGQHAPSEIPSFFRAAEETGARLVVGNRMAHPGPMPWARRWTNRFMSWQLSRLAGQPWPDTQNGYRLLHLPAWRQLHLHASHFEIESEMLLAFAGAGHPIAFVPSLPIYGREKSKISPLRDAWRWLRWLRHRRP